MSGQSNLQVLIRSKAPLWILCIIYQQILKEPQSSTESTLITCTKCDKAWIKISWFFKKLCEDVEPKYVFVVTLSLVKALSWHVLSSTFHLWQGKRAFTEDGKHEFAKHFVEIDFLTNLTCIMCLNALKLQVGSNMHISDFPQRKSFLKK